MVSVEIVLDILSFPGAVLLLLCVFLGHKYEETDPDFSHDTSYAPLQGEEDNATGEKYSNENVTPFAKAGFLSTMTFWWLNPLMKQGKEKILEENDIPELRQADRAQTCYFMFKEQLSKQKTKSNICIPFNVLSFIEVADGNAAFEYEGYALAGGLFLAKCLESFSERQWFFQTRIIGLQVRSFLSAAIYQKQLRLSNAAKVTHSPGQIMNYVTVDAYRIATVAALIVIILTMVATSPLAKLQHKYQTKLMVSLTRIVKFLEAPELENRNTRQNCNEKEVEQSIFIKATEISWETNPANATLRNINLEVKQGEKVAICGEVGSGKSTLLAAILGEVPSIKGIVNVYGKIAYVSQTSWIQTGSIRENILFGSPMDPLRYQEVLRRCSLIKDLEMLPFGDLTEIGERGVTLSGGQKQRVQLARALYQDADVYLLDDPFSAVDAQTATSLFNEYVMGALSRKTVLLVTHQVDFLPAFDSVLFMTEEKLLRASTYDELLASSQEFQNLVNAHHDTVGSERQAKYVSSGKSKTSKSEIQGNYNEELVMSSLGDQLIKQEERESGDTGLKPYIQYLKQDKGFLYFSLATICHIIFIVGQIIQNYWLAANLQDSHVSSDLTVVDLDLAFRLSTALGSFMISYSGYAILAILTWPILFLIIPMVYLTILLQRYYFASAKELMRTDGTTRSLIASHLAESIAGAMTIRAFGEEERFFLKTLNLIDRNASPYFQSFSANEWLIQRLEILCAIVLSSSALAMTLLQLGASTSERLEQYMHIPSEAAEVIEGHRPMNNWPVVGEVKIYDLKVRYRPNAPLVLQGISCIFEGGHKIGIVGRTGSGKTTLISALFRLVEPTDGMIIIDGIDISTVGLHDLRSRLGIIPQDPTLFSGSVRYNLDPQSEHTDQEIWEVLRKMSASRGYLRKRGGLEFLSDNCFVWDVHYFKRSQILVLDEATASIDNATDSLIQKTIQTEFANCTVITVAHRIPTVMDCTKVLAISDGKIVEYDEPLKLMNKEGSLFGQLVKEYWSHSAS
uniref:ABC-type xenobiotic transporter n=1 Tax=Fagus sylvatica TaxID=28930 RepID=A0A2N9HER7_FAGSY